MTDTPNLDRLQAATADLTLDQIHAAHAHLVGALADQVDAGTFDKALDRALTFARKEWQGGR